MDARLLCIAAQMLSPAATAPADAFKALDALDAELDKSPARPPIDSAVRLRAGCLAALTEARRPNTEAAPEAGAADALLDELAKASLEPARDDRGVAVAFRDLFDGAALKGPAKERLAALGQVAKAHPTFPVLVVLHGARGRAGATDTERANAIAQALRAGGASRVEAKAVGDALPVAPPPQPKARNERAEIVFVAPAR
jgi:outer membrane protein OmpA-like peptidoglycan-associated protein